MPGSSASSRHLHWLATRQIEGPCQACPIRCSLPRNWFAVKKESAARLALGRFFVGTWCSPVLGSDQVPSRSCAKNIPARAQTQRLGRCVRLVFRLGIRCGHHKGKRAVFPCKRRRIRRWWQRVQIRILHDRFFPFMTRCGLRTRRNWR